jgi:dimethylhistidine N-methyltransferase
MLTEFAQSVNEGLSKRKKHLPSRYFYNAEGDALFQQIMQMPEYYPTRAEYAIFNQQKEDLLKALNHPQGFDLVELGAGDGYKTKVLLQYFLAQKVSFTYYPVDISADVLRALKSDLNEQFPHLPVKTLNFEYFTAIEAMNKLGQRPKVILFLGGNIGNFTAQRARSFFRRLEAIMKPGDKLLCGIDLKKNPRTILKAYDDAQGITARFNLNVLKRINEELGGHFNLDLFQHYPNYNPVNGECRSYLISKKAQKVKVDYLDKTFFFDSAEPIHTEISKKYSLREIEALAQKSGFKAQKHFTDQQKYFVDSLWLKE